MQDKPGALVTGANKGIGLQIAKDLAAYGFTVLVGSRNLKHWETAAKSVGADARVLQMVMSSRARHRRDPCREPPSRSSRPNVL